MSVSDSKPPAVDPVIFSPNTRTGWGEWGDKAVLNQQVANLRRDLEQAQATVKFALHRIETAKPPLSHAPAYAQQWVGQAEAAMQKLLEQLGDPSID